MNKPLTDPNDKEMLAGVVADNPSTRLKSVLAIGINPNIQFVDVLVARCAIEPDFNVREVLTWALTRFDADITIPMLLRELNSEVPQARSQALHTISKLKDSRAWPAITESLLEDSNEEVAQAAWRAAVVLVPENQVPALAEKLARLFGWGGRATQLSLSRALIALGAEAIEPILLRAKLSEEPAIKSHAEATYHLLHNPEETFQYGVDQVKRIFAPG